VRLARLELEHVVRHPIWVLLFAYAAGTFYMRLLEGTLVPVVYLGLEQPLLGLGRTLFSAGEWGRSLFLALEVFGGIPLSLFTALLSTRVFSSELGHREVLWVSYRSSQLSYVFVKLVAISTFVLLIYALGAAATFLNPSARASMNMAGWQYLPAYCLVTWLRIAVWVTLTGFFFSLTRSQWATVAIVFALQAIWFGTAGGWGGPSLLHLLHRNMIGWNFVSVFAPVGVIPRAFLLQAIAYAGTVTALTGAILRVRKRFPELAGLRSPTAKAAVLVGVAVALGAGSWIALEIRANTAPFSAAHLWDGEVTLDRPYVWSRDYRLLVHPGQYTSVIVPPGHERPDWLLSSDRRVTVHEMATEAVIEGNVGRETRTAPASLILAHPSQTPYPSELDTAISQYLNAVSPVVEELGPWFEGPLTVAFVWPEDVLPSLTPSIHRTEFLFGPACLLGTTESYLRRAGWAVSEALGDDRATKLYIHMYFCTRFPGADCSEEVDEVLEWLRKRAGGESPDFKVALGRGFHWASWSPGDALRMIQHWETGEELGHEDYVKTLLEEGQGG